MIKCVTWNIKSHTDIKKSKKILTDMNEIRFNSNNDQSRAIAQRI